MFQNFSLLEESIVCPSIDAKVIPPNLDILVEIPVEDPHFQSEKDDDLLSAVDSLILEGSGLKRAMSDLQEQKLGICLSIVLSQTFGRAC